MSAVTEIRADAERIRFGRMLATIFTAVFVAFGWVVGTVWLVVRFVLAAVWWLLRYCGTAVRYGYREGAHIPRADKSAGGPS